MAARSAYGRKCLRRIDRNHRWTRCGLLTCCIDQGVELLGDVWRSLVPIMRVRPGADAELGAAFPRVCRARRLPLELALLRSPQEPSDVVATAKRVDPTPHAELVRQRELVGGNRILIVLATRVGVAAPLIQVRK